MHLTSLRLRLAAISILAAATAWGASFQSRYSHTATLLPDGNILVVGGSTSTAVGVSTTSAQLILQHRDMVLDAAPLPGNVARASHTATLLPNGEVLVVGGSNGSTVLNTA